MWDFVFLDVDWNATKKAVEKVLLTVGLFKRIVPERKMPSVTQSYPKTDADLIHSNQTYRPVEASAVYNVDLHRDKAELVERVLHAIDTILSETEQEIITKKYLIPYRISDIQIYSDLFMSERTYYRLKNSALQKLSFALGIQVMKHQENRGDG